MRMLRPVIWVVGPMVIFAACGGTSATDGADQTVPESVSEKVPGPTSRDGASVMALSERIGIIDEAVGAWRNATSIETAQMAAEEAANLIVGPNGPGYGDRNGDGVISGETTVGVLPGLDGTPAGLAIPLATNECITRDVLGGTWDDPETKWGAMLTAIDDWRPNNNTMPSLASHPMRTVGWATFTLRSDSLDEAHVYAGHAKLHVDIALRALVC